MGFKLVVNISAANDQWTTRQATSGRCGVGWQVLGRSIEDHSGARACKEWFVTGQVVLIIRKTLSNIHIHADNSYTLIDASERSGLRG
jgi:hypothetical protein